MKTIVRVLIFTLLALPALAQKIEYQLVDSTGASQSTRLKLSTNGTRFGQKGFTGNFSGFSFKSELDALTNIAVTTTGSYANPTWLTGLAWSKITGTPTTVAGYNISDAVVTTGSYTNPTWLSALAWSKITGTPTTLSGYNITDGLSSTGSYNNPTWLTGLAWSKITSTPTTISGYNITDAVATSAIFPIASVSTYSGLAGVSVPPANYIKFVFVGTDSQYSDTQDLYLIKPNGKIHKVILNPSEN